MNRGPSTAARAARQASRRRIETARALAEDLRQQQLRLAENCKMPSLPEFAVAASLSPVPLALLSRGGAIMAAAGPFQSFFNTPAQELLNRPLSDLLHPRDVPALFKFLAGCDATRRTRRAEFAMAVPGQPARDVLLIVSAAEPAVAGEHTYFRAAFIDLREIEIRDFGPRAAVQDTRLIEAIDGIVWEADFPTRYTFVSGQAERLLGWSPQSWLAEPDFWEKRIYHEDRERAVAAREAAVAGRASHVLQYRMVAADRRLLWVKDSAVFMDKAGVRARMCGIITDITGLETAREQLKQVNENLELAVAERTAKMEQSLEAMETLCYGIAHDLKAPLRGLQGFVNILTTDYQFAFDDNAKMYAARCQAALRRMAELVDAVLAYGRLNHTLPELVPVHVNAAVEHIVNALEPEITRTHAKVNVQMSLPSVIGNPYLFEQALTNLLANALKFSRPGVAPEISISGVQTERDTVCLTITDNGIGISPEFTKRMFGMFQKFHAAAQYSGTGIGLAVVKRSVELMNGQLGVISDPDHGSSFWIELPAARGG